MTSSRIAISATVRAIGPAVSRIELSGTTPVRDTAPTVGRRPAKAACAAGLRTGPPLTAPTPTAPNLAAVAAQVPPDEPPVANAVLYGLRVNPETTELILSPIP